MKHFLIHTPPLVAGATEADAKACYSDAVNLIMIIISPPILKEIIMKENSKLQLLDIDMTKHVDVDLEKVRLIVSVKKHYLEGTMALGHAREMLQAHMTYITPQEFAVAEQYLKDYGITDDTLEARVDDIFSLVDGLLKGDIETLPKGHPVHTYRLEVTEIRHLLSAMATLLEGKFILNPWKDIYEKLTQINTHFARKQNQVYPALEAKGFDKPSKVMWALENQVRDIIKEAHGYLNAGNEEAFLALQPEVIEQVAGMMMKESDILYPTMLAMLSEEDFIHMRQGDDAIGYCLIDAPPAYGSAKASPADDASFLSDLSALMAKHGLSAGHVLDVAQGQLTLQQINLIFKHLPVDLSFVDEDDLVKFYSDTPHRIFPRSPGVIGRDVRNCHPRDSVDMVMEILRAFKAGEQDKAEFWLEMGDRFIYILYTALKDDQGHYKGTLEMMQDVTAIRQLQGSRRLLSWLENDPTPADDLTQSPKANAHGLTPDLKIGALLTLYPQLKTTLIAINPKYKMLNNPIVFKTMANIATLTDVANRGGMSVDLLIEKLTWALDDTAHSEDRPNQSI